MGYESFEQAVEAVYREVVAESGVESIKRQEAFDIASDRIGQLILDGVIAVPHDQAVRAALMAADDRDGKAVDRVLSVMASGQNPIDYEDDPFLETVVVLGDGMRKSFRHVNSDDLEAMDRLRYQNLHRAQEAYHRWREQYEGWTPCVRRHGTIGAAYAAGDVPEFDNQ